MKTLIHLTILFLTCTSLPACAQQEIADIGWPRQKTAGTYALTAYQPQIDEWIDHKDIGFRMAVSVQGGQYTEPRYGVLEIAARTWIDRNQRSVLFTDVASTICFAVIEGTEAQELESAVRSVLPDGNTFTVSLDRMLAQLDRSKAMERDVKVNLDPPKILYSNEPAALVVFMGNPSFKPVPNTKLLFAANTNWDLFLETGSSTYFLLYEQGWLQAKSLESVNWQPTSRLPTDLSKLPNDDNWSDVKKNVPGKPLAKAPKLLTTTEPAELIITDGEPAMTPIPGTDLLYVTNTESDRFLNSKDSYYYFLVAGRWFRARDLNGPWSAATNDLPTTFAKISENPVKAEVLVSVPGTPEAEEAVIGDRESWRHNRQGPVQGHAPIQTNRRE